MTSNNSHHHSKNHSLESNQGHDHCHAPKNFDRSFAIGIALNVGFVVIEAIYGALSNSLALIADAGHNLSDVLALLLAWGASVWVRRTPTERRTYGFRRSSILVALINAIILLVAVGGIAWEAMGRILSPEPVASGTVMSVATIGVFINGFTAWLFISGKKQDVNIRGAYLHMLTDAAISLGVVLAAVAIYFTNWLWLDPAASIFIVIVITYSTWGLFRESLDLALDAVPKNINPAEVEAYLSGIAGISEIHDLHIWSMSTTEVALTVHLVKSDGQLDDELLSQINKELSHKFRITHTTLQLEQGIISHPCAQAPTDAL
jgi:cobalt-zinc-cadmium efflux system protein